MQIRAAVFDCDGTLLDSMPMWNRLFPEWLSSHGIADAQALADTYEYMNFEDECYFFHDEFGVCESREAALDEMRRRVVWEYEHTVQPFPGVRDFLDEPASAGIPMAIGSSTSVPLLEIALAAHGLRDYFRAVIYTGDVGADKQHPDIYYAARDAIAGDTATTWVFEDAPFGARTAQAAGFPVVCLFNDHDGRDEVFMAEHSDILVHGYPELSLSLLEDYERPFDGVPVGELHALIVAGSPDRSSARLVASLADEADYVIACDRGADVLHTAGTAPDVFCGDDDTVSTEAGAWAHEVSRRVIHYPADKYVSDMTLAFACARHEAARRHARLRATLTCCSGGRTDHALCVLGELVAARDCAPRVVEDIDGKRVEYRILSPDGAPDWDFAADEATRALTSGATADEGPVGKTFSAVALVGDAVVSETGMRWELSKTTLAALSDRGLSNEVVSPAARVTCQEGVLACFLIG